MFAAVLTLSVSCIDKDFDLSDIDTGDIGIGSDDSEFRLPLARITVLGSAIDGTYGSIEDIFNEADIWTPTAYESVDLTQLKNNAYIDNLLDNLFGELHTNNAKLRDVADMLENTPSYRTAIAGTIPAELNGISVRDYISGHLSVAEEYSRDKIREIIFKHLDSMNNCIEDIEEDIDGLDIDEGVINALTGDNSATAIYGSALNRLPIDCKGTFALLPADSYGAAEEPYFSINDISLPYDSKQEIGQTNITAEALNGIRQDMKMRVNFTATTYYPRHTVPAATSPAVEFVLNLYKKGGLNLSDL